MANTLAAVGAGATHVQGCVNGYGERAGNADLAAAIPDLSLKLSVRTIPPDRLERLTAVSHHIAELVNIAPNPQQPYVGASVFAHKAGLHASAIARRRDLYEHVSPGAGRQRDAGRGLRDGRPLDARDEGRPSSGSSSTARCSAGCSTSSSSSSTRATTSRWPTARSSCSCGGRPAGSPTSSRSSRSG